MTLNRQLQRDLLERAADAYPATLRMEELVFEAETADVVKTIYYLHSHGLIDAVFRNALGVRFQQPFTIKATHKGLDFLADDGGLSAILGVVTVRLHEDTIRLLVTQKIEDSDLPEEEKRPLLQAVRELPGEAIKHLTTKLLDLGLDNLPRATEIIHKALQSGLGS